MKLATFPFLWIASTFASSKTTRAVAAFVPSHIHKPKTSLYRSMSAENHSCEDPHPFSRLPGDPSLILTTNVDLGDKKIEIMKACSKALSARTGKPEKWVAVSINDNASVIFGGSDAPTALGCVYSLGAVAMESNGQITSDVTDLLEPYGVAADRIYINFFDMERANIGWNRKTFAG